MNQHEELIELINSLDNTGREYIEHIISFLDREVEQLEKLHKQNLKEISKVKRALQNKCKHEETEYCPDASGNNDSCYICLICGLEKKRFK